MKRLLLAVLFLGCALPAAAQYPNRNVTMLAGYPAGGLVDIVARLVAEGMKPRLAQPGELKPMVDGGKVRALLNFTPKRHAAFPDVPSARELGWDVSNGVWYLLLMPKGTPAPVVRYLHDAAKAAIDDPKFAQTMAARGIDVDYRQGEALRADLWREYKALTPVLKRTGMIKK